MVTLEIYGLAETKKVKIKKVTFLNRRPQSKKSCKKTFTRIFYQKSVSSALANKPAGGQYYETF
jgi:hypothetical protein